jgi:formylglycine-generating enzyme required for sulfatase activity
VGSAGTLILTNVWLSSSKPKSAGKCEIRGGYGFYDMSGNVSEWMSDCKDSECVEHVIRSSAWGDLDIMSDSTFRITVTSTDRGWHLRFRFARTRP